MQGRQKKFNVIRAYNKVCGAGLQCIPLTLYCTMVHVLCALLPLSLNGSNRGRLVNVCPTGTFIAGTRQKKKCKSSNFRDGTGTATASLSSKPLFQIMHSTAQSHPISEMVPVQLQPHYLVSHSSK
jgi:hypothetical protein